MKNVFALVAGLFFGIGLIVSGMSNPAKIINFLDITGQWDPSLALVMCGAIGVGLLGFRLANQREKTLCDDPLQLPSIGKIDPRLLIGSTLFGVGWGLAGICPGPGFVQLGAGTSQGVIFVLALVIGMALFEVTLGKKPCRSPQNT